MIQLKMLEPLTAPLIPMLRIPASAGQNERCYLFHLFYHVQIRLGSAPRGLKNCGQASDIDIEAMIGKCSIR
jgi:hypothetical protein